MSFSRCYGSFTQCIFDFDIRNKQMFTEARAFSRVNYFLFSGEPAGFFLNLHSEISYPTPFSETVQRDDTKFGPFSLLFGCQLTLEIRKTAAGNMEENSRQIRKKQPFYTLLWYVFITDDLVYLNLIANSCVMPFHSYLYI